MPVALAQDSAGNPAVPVRVIFDTDMDSDCDDVGALAMLHALADAGEAEILATIVSSRNEWSPGCTAAINAYFKRPEIPVGAPQTTGSRDASKFARAIAERFRHRFDTKAAVPDANEVYRQVLAGAADQSVVIVTVGDLTNLANLLKTPKDERFASGPDLIQQKVKQWVCMGGNFVGHPAVDDLKLTNNNFTVDKASSLIAVRDWPGQIMFVGREIGSVPSGLAVGRKLVELPEDNPVRAAYASYFGGRPKDRHVADQTAVLYAVRGLGDYWEAETKGFMDLSPDMTFRWNYAADKGHGYLLKKRVNGKPLDREVEATIEQLMMHLP